MYYNVKKKRVKEYITSTVIFDGIYLILFVGIYFLVYAINGFEQGSNHYSSQISRLFPIGLNTIVFGAIGCGIYFILLIINTGFLPLSTVFSKWHREKQKSWFINFIVISIVFLILEIVFMIVLTEEGTGTLPHKFLFRYFQIFVPPILILFIKYKEENNLIGSLKYILVMEAILCIALVYFILMQGKTRQAIIDGHLFLFLENTAKYIVPYADAIAMILLMSMLMVVYLWCRKKNENIEKILKAAVVGMMFFWIVDVIQLPYYNNMIAGGKQIQNDSIRIAEYLNEENYEYVYYVYKDEEEKNSYTRNFYGYIKQPYQVVSKADVSDLLQQKQKIALLTYSDFLANDEDLEEIDLNNERLMLYIPQ